MHKLQLSVSLVLWGVSMSFAQSSFLASMAAGATTTAADGKQITASEAITLSTHNQMELNQSECVVTVTDQVGKKLFTTILMDGFLALPLSLGGMVHNVDVMTEQSHRTFEISVREDDDFVDIEEPSFIATY